jgi:hypothetical protein
LPRTIVTAGSASTRVRTFPFEQRAAGQVSSEPAASAASGVQYVAGGREVDLRRLVVQYRHLGGGHVVEQAREQFLELVGTAGHQQVNVLALRYGRAVDRLVGEVVALVKRDPVEGVGEHPGCTEPGDASSDHNGVPGALRFGIPRHRLK